jgi:hypothetical protein
MAWGEKPSAALTYTFKDETGSISSLQLDVPEDTDADVALTAAAALRPLIEAISDCAVISYGLAYSSFDDAPAAPTAGSRVERKGTFVFRTAAGKTARYQVPGIISAAVESSGRIDEDNLAIAAFVAALIGVDTIFCDSNGVDLTSLKEAYERYKGTTRKQLPSNRSPD